MTKIENMYETPSIPADQNDLEKLRKKVVIVSVCLAIIALIAIVAIGIAVYAATRGLESNSDNQKASSNGMALGSTSGGIISSGSACTGVECKNGGSCFNIYPDNYMCVCVATFYGRNCQLGEY